MGEFVLSMETGESADLSARLAQGRADLETAVAAAIPSTGPSDAVSSDGFAAAAAHLDAEFDSFEKLLDESAARHFDELANRSSQLRGPCCSSSLDARLTGVMIGVRARQRAMHVVWWRSGTGRSPAVPRSVHACNGGWR